MISINISILIKSLHTLISNGYHFSGIKKSTTDNDETGRRLAKTLQPMGISSWKSWLMVLDFFPRRTERVFFGVNFLSNLAFLATSEVGKHCHTVNVNVFCWSGLRDTKNTTNTWTNKIDMLNFPIWKVHHSITCFLFIYSYHHLIISLKSTYLVSEKIMVCRSTMNIYLYISTAFPCEVMIHCPPAVDLFEGQVRVPIGANISIRDYEPLPGATDENSKVGFWHLKKIDEQKLHPKKNKHILNPPRMVFWDAIYPSSFTGGVLLGFHVRSFVFGGKFRWGIRKDQVANYWWSCCVFGRAWVGVDNGPMPEKG